LEAAVPGSLAKPEPECRYTLAIATREGKRVGTGCRVVLPSGSFALLTAAHVLIAAVGSPCVLYAGDRSTDLDPKWPLLFWSPLKLPGGKVGVDLALLSVPDAVFAALGVRAVRLTKGVSRMRVSVHGFAATGERLCSSGRADLQRDLCHIQHEASTEPSWSGGPITLNGLVVGVHTGYNPVTGKNTGASLSPFLPALESEASYSSDGSRTVRWDFDDSGSFEDRGHEGLDARVAYSFEQAEAFELAYYGEDGSVMPRGTRRKANQDPRSGADWAWHAQQAEMCEDPGAWANMMDDSVPESGTGNHSPSERLKPSLFRRLACLASLPDGHEDEECFPHSSKSRAVVKAVLESGKGSIGASSKRSGKNQALLDEAPPKPLKGSPKSGASPPPKPSKAKLGGASTATEVSQEMMESVVSVKHSLDSVITVLAHLREVSLEGRISHWEDSCTKLAAAARSQADPAKQGQLTKQLTALRSQKPTLGLLAEPVLSEILSLFTVPELQRVVALSRLRMQSERK